MGTSSTSSATGHTCCDTPLTGFARVEAGEVMRIRALSRYVVEWGKVKAWQYLGLRL